MEKARPNGLIALCILSWVWMVFALLSILSEVNTGRLTEAEIRAQKIAIIESQTPQTNQAAPWMVDEMVSMLEISAENYTTMIVFNLVAIAIGAFGVFMMFQQRKNGFYLYVGYSIISIAYWLYYFYDLTFGQVLIAVSVVFSALFVILYGTQLKKMT